MTMEEAPDQARIAFQILIVGNTLAGLTLVFLGHTVSSFSSYRTDEKPSVKGTYLWRAWLAFGGLATALLAGLSGLAHNWIQQDWIIGLGVFLLLVAMVCVLIAALNTALGIK